MQKHAALLMGAHKACDQKTARPTYQGVKEVHATANTYSLEVFKGIWCAQPIVGIEGT